MTKKNNKKLNKRLRNLVVITSLSAIILIVSTFAWFIGTQTVNVSSFDVEIAGIDGLSLSLDGKTFSDTVGINSENFNDTTVVYENNTNTWSDGGLKPVSTIGEIDPAVSRLRMFEKTSLTATKGGYRLMANEVPNKGDAEVKGYVAFDLFIKNQSGTEYFKDVNFLNEEAIYLTNDSEVTVAASGTKDTGIENSVRVAFAQIGRVQATVTDDEVITGISCTATEGSSVSPICTDRPATIWEPNDTKHVQNAINYYNKSCKARTGETLNAEGAYSGNCKNVTNGLYSETYAIAKDVVNPNSVDVYDGTAYNGYVGSLVTRGEDNAITTGVLEYPANNIITDSMKFQEGTNRPEFMRLAPNSITKVRIYVYIEGQDIDNHDYAAIGKAISVKFGFTKQRFTEDDIDYEGPNNNQGAGPNAANDKTAPVITLPTDLNNSYAIGGTEEFTYVPSGIEAYDLNAAGEEVDLTADITYEGTVNTNVAGTYIVVYKVRDAAGNLGTKLRTVTVSE